MPFQKGRAKTGGRPPGVSQAFKLALTVKEKLEELGFDPIAHMHKLIHDPSTPVEVSAKLTCELSKFIHAQRKAVEHTNADGTPINANFNVVLINGQRSIEPAGDGGVSGVLELPLPPKPV